MRWTDLETRDRPTTNTPPVPDIDSFIEALKWESPIGYDLKLTEHINVQELKALNDEVQRRSVRGDHDLRIVMACDSRVVVGAMAKGRSSSRVLSKHLRRLCSICVAHGLSWVFFGLALAVTPAKPRCALPHSLHQSPSPIGCRNLLIENRRTLQLKAVEAGCAEQQFCHISLEFQVAQQFVSAHHQQRTCFGNSIS